MISLVKVLCDDQCSFLPSMQNTIQHTPTQTRSSNYILKSNNSQSSSNPRIHHLCTSPSCLPSHHALPPCPFPPPPLPQHESNSRCMSQRRQISHTTASPHTLASFPPLPSPLFNSDSPSHRRTRITERQTRTILRDTPRIEQAHTARDLEHAELPPEGHPVGEHADPLIGFRAAPASGVSPSSRNRSKRGGNGKEGREMGRRGRRRQGREERKGKGDKPCSGKFSTAGIRCFDLVRRTAC
jgi:hypothetical protein